MIDWLKVKNFVHRRTLFATAAVVEEGRVRLFPIGSLRIQGDGRAIYFEIFARPVPAGASISFLAVDVNPFFWLWSLLKGRFAHPPALRLEGALGERRQTTDQERQTFHRRVGWLLRTKGGKLLWSNPKQVREVQFVSVQPVRVGQMTGHLKNWAASA